MYKIYTTAMHSLCVVPLACNVDVSGKYRHSTIYGGRVLMIYATLKDNRDRQTDGHTMNIEYNTYPSVVEGYPAREREPICIGKKSRRVNHSRYIY